MPCYHPLHGYYSKSLNPTGKRSIVFKLSRALSPEHVPVACGKCYGCKLERSRQWAVRGLHEVQLHDDNSFITLTYGPEHLPSGGTLIKKHWQDFAKRLRKRRPPRSVRYLHCGEYGVEARRPHYHAILFGVRFLDQQPYDTSADGCILYTSAELAALWPFGFSTVGEATFESIAYVARYTVKKNQPKLTFMGEERYEHIDLDTGEVLPVQSEYLTCSLKPAIGKNWFDQFKGDVYPSDEVIIRGKQQKPPKYYDTLLGMRDAEQLAVIKDLRKHQALDREADNTTRRLAEREEIKIAQTSNLKRGLK